MKKAFIDENGVLRAWGYTDANEGNTPVAVDDGFNLEPGKYAYANGQWVEYVAPAPVPQVVTMRQARLALLAAGMLDDVEALLAGLPGDDGRAARITWEFSSEVKRDQPLVLQLGPAIGLDDAALDQLFITAATL